MIGLSPNIVILTVRPKDSDFRYPLAQELQALGHKVTYIYLKRRPEVTDMASGATEIWSLPRLFRFFGSMRRSRERTVVFNSTNLAFPWLSIGLRAISGIRWCLDMHDLLLYDAEGWQRIRMLTEQRCLVAQSDWIVHAASSLKELFPRSEHIGNASSLKPLPKQDADPKRVLVLASIDDRFDYDMLEAAAEVCPDRRFEIHGRIQRGATDKRDRIDAILKAHPNVSYEGPYSDATLPELFSHYVVSFASYRTERELTGFIDPLRFYHCLASDVGVVSTPIAQARQMSDRILLLEKVEDLGDLLDRAAQDRRGPARTWAQVAAQVSAMFRGSSDPA